MSPFDPRRTCMSVRPFQNGSLARYDALLDPGGGYGAAIKNGRQDERGENAKRKLSKGTQPRQDEARLCASHSIETFVGFGL
jgi:hypothetical protein